MGTVKQNSWMVIAILSVFSQIIVSPAFADNASDIEHAKKLMSGHRFKQAAEHLKKILPNLEGRDQIEMQLQLGAAYRYLYDHDNALATFNEVLKNENLTNDDRAFAYITMGVCLQLSKRPDEAIDKYNKIVALEGISSDRISDAYLRMGYAYNKKGDEDAAVEAFIKSAEVEGASRFNQQNAYVKAGMSLQRQNKYEEAAELYRKALKVGTGGPAGKHAANYLLECEAAANADPNFYIAPYVTNVSQTEAGIYWISTKGAATGSVTVTDGETTINAEATLTRMHDRDAYRQTVKLKDLKPYTLYNYTAKTGDQTAKGSFHTARDEPGPTRFVVLGDTQGGWQYHAKIGKLIAAEDPDFVLHVGDCVEQGQRWDEWKIQMFDPGKPYLAKAPVWVARGNHDGGAYFNVIFDRDQPWQTFTFGDLQVVVLNSTYYMGERSGDKQLAWLEEIFSNSSSKWMVGTMHHSLFHTSNGDILVGQSNFRPLVEEASPDIIFNGHYHKYSRQLPIGKPGRKPVINVVTGGGGGGNGTPSMPSPIVAKAYESFHFCVVEIDGNKLHLTAKDIEGNTFDEYTLIKSSDGLYQESVMQKAVDPETFAKIRVSYHDLKYPRYNRVDLTGVYKDGKVTLDKNILKNKELPEDTMLIVDRSGDTAWWLEPTTLNLSKAELTFDAELPKGASTDDPRTIGPLSVTVTLQINGRKFEPHTFPVTLRYE